MVLNDSIRHVTGVGEKKEKTLAKLGISTVRDLLYFLPRHYRDYTETRKLSDVKIGETALFAVKIFSAPLTRRVRKGLEITSFQVSDESAIVGVDIFNQKHIKQYIKQDDTVYIYGKLAYQMKQLCLAGPEIYFSKPEYSFLPIYPLTAGLTQHGVRKLIKTAFAGLRADEPYSSGFLKEFDIESLYAALQDVHFPQTLEQARRGRARLVFDELMVFCRMIELLNEEKTGDSEIRLDIGKKFMGSFVQRLGFAPTGGQLRIMNEIAGDLAGETYMNRLVQGDVGSGKTAIAFYAMECMRASGYQSVMMAPTEILAEQHCNAAKELFPAGEVACITGSLKGKGKKVELEKLRMGEAKIIIGTHALIYGDVEFDNLGLIITDEQHRFGVKQRAAIAGKGKDVHTLTMSATPIPRSLALVLYGKTDISILDEMPPGRKEIKTYLIRKRKYGDMIGFIRREMDAGRQVYMVCPLIEDGKDDELQSATAMFEEVRETYAGTGMALLHGRLKAKEKQEIMQGFAAGEIKMLVSTTVIEVGVNVPNASVMAVINAERFGLAQLHQLRGRVGRGADQAYCFLLSDHTGAFERLKVLADTNNGFEIAEKDMEFRGVGDVFGTRQHGKGVLKIANLVQDMRQLEKARHVLEILAKNDRFAWEYGGITQAAKEVMDSKMLEIALN